MSSGTQYPSTRIPRCFRASRLRLLHVLRSEIWSTFSSRIGYPPPLLIIRYPTLSRRSNPSCFQSSFARIPMWNYRRRCLLLFPPSLRFIRSSESCPEVLVLDKTTRKFANSCKRECHCMLSLSCHLICCIRSLHFASR